MAPGRRPHKSAAARKARGEGGVTMTTPNPQPDTAEQIQAAAELEELCSRLDISQDELQMLLGRS
jgi:hypothetical protein